MSYVFASLSSHSHKYLWWLYFFHKAKYQLDLRSYFCSYFCSFFRKQCIDLIDRLVSYLIFNNQWSLHHSIAEQGIKFGSSCRCTMPVLPKTGSLSVIACDRWNQSLYFCSYRITWELPFHICHRYSVPNCRRLDSRWWLLLLSQCRHQPKTELDRCQFLVHGQWRLLGVHPWQRWTGHVGLLCKGHIYETTVTIWTFVIFWDNHQVYIYYRKLISNFVLTFPVT